MNKLIGTQTKQLHVLGIVIFKYVVHCKELITLTQNYRQRCE